jgi:cytochrome c oxidase subunit 2
MDTIRIRGGASINRLRKHAGGVLHACRAATFCIPAVAVAAGNQNALAPAGVQAQRILELWNLTLVVCALVFACILGALLMALIRSRRPGRSLRPVPEPETVQSDRISRSWVMGASIASALLLVGLLVADVLTGHALSRLPMADALHIEMVGYQWWWEARYPASDGGPAFGVAGDLHVPVGRPVVVTLKSADVIHTFWVPNLHGKKDMLPGRTTTIEFRADRPGLFRGQCAEFCGLEHALMAFGVTADAPAQFAAWQAHQQAPRSVPAADDTRRGEQLFLSSKCAGCHTVRGTPADGGLGPDLTHVASRATLAAGTFANEPAALAHWIRDPQQLKPGSTMPGTALASDDMTALVAYLGGLQ